MSLKLFTCTLALGILFSCQSAFDRTLKESSFQGAVLVAKGGKVLFCKAYGLADVENGVPNTPQTVFRIASITKPFTGIAILQLHERGLLNIHDPIAKYLDYPEGDKITIHHLLCHTSGIPNITKLPNFAAIQLQPTTPQETMRHFQALPLRFTPGERCEYSDSGYIVLGAIVEAVTGLSYAEYVQEHIFGPLKMHSTYCDDGRQLIPHRALGYAQKERKLFSANYIDMTLPYAAGGIASTVEDLYRLMEGLGVLLSQKSLDLLFTVHAEGQSIACGYGFRIGPKNPEFEGLSQATVGHFGGIEGFKAALIRSDDFTMIILSNGEETPIHLLTQELNHVYTMPISFRLFREGCFQICQL